MVLITVTEKIPTLEIFVLTWIDSRKFYSWSLEVFLLHTLLFHAAFGSFLSTRHNNLLVRLKSVKNATKRPVRWHSNIYSVFSDTGNIYLLWINYLKQKVLPSELYSSIFFQSTYFFWLIVFSYFFFYTSVCSGFDFLKWPLKFWHMQAVLRECLSSHMWYISCIYEIYIHLLHLFKESVSLTYIANCSPVSPFRHNNY